MRLSDAGLHRRQTKALYSNHRSPPCLTEDATRDRSNRLLEVAFGTNSSFSGRSQRPAVVTRNIRPSVLFHSNIKTPGPLNRAAGPSRLRISETVISDVIVEKSSGAKGEFAEIRPRDKSQSPAADAGAPIKAAARNTIHVRIALRPLTMRLSDSVLRR
jgi:hypothetical protein